MLFQLEGNLSSRGPDPLVTFILYMHSGCLSVTQGRFYEHHKKYNYTGLQI